MYDERLAGQVRRALGDRSGLRERKMFGGIAFMVNGNMACAVRDDMLIVRVGSESYEQALASPHTRPFDLAGRPMTGWVMVHPLGYESEDDLREWVQRGVGSALALPPK